MAPPKSIGLPGHARILASTGARRDRVRRAIAAGTSLVSHDRRTPHLSKGVR
jgi:hypothetical protein